jgi:hypothetical protein
MMPPQMGGMEPMMPPQPNMPIDVAPTNYIDPATAMIPGMGQDMGPQMGGLRKAFGGNPPPQRFGNGRF